MFRYAEVERALALANDVDDDSLGAFRGRIKHLQRIGIVPASPGKGQKITYDREAVYRWAFCIELAEFGIDPVRIKAIIDLTWNGLKQAFLQDHLKEDVLFVAHPMMLSKAISSRHPQPDLPFSAADDERLTLIARASTVKIAEVQRALVINLTAVRERINAALALGPRPDQ